MSDDHVDERGRGFAGSQPDFFLDERAPPVGVRALAMVTVNYPAAKTD